jgi:soluble lytic murein transglycosylase-like protein
MVMRSIAAVVLVAGFGLGLAIPAPAQLASYTDASGKRIYINADPPPARHTTAPHASTTRPRNGNERVILPGRLERVVREAAERHQLDPALLRAVIKAESGGDPLAISRKGALGLMQLTPATAEQMGVGNAFDPEQNVDGGARFLRSLLDRYNGDLTKSLAAYNAGTGAVDRFGGVPRYSETRAYVRKVTETYFRPGSDRLSSLWEAPRHPIRREVEANGRVVFTNE